MRKLWFAFAVIGVGILTSALAMDASPNPPSPDALASLKGYRLRVVKPGQMMDHAVLHDRVTILVDAENRITEIRLQ